MREFDKGRLELWLLAGATGVAGAAQDHEHVWRDTKKGLALLESWLGVLVNCESYLDRLYMLDKARENFGKAGGLLFAKLAEKLIEERTKKLEGLWRIGADVADKKGWPYDLVANDRPDPSEETVQAWFDGELHPELEKHYENLLADHAHLRRLYEEKAQEALSEIWVDRLTSTLARKLVDLPEGEVSLALDGDRVVLVVGETRYNSGLRRGEFGAACFEVEIRTGKILVTLTLCDMDGEQQLCLLGSEAQMSLASRAMQRMLRPFDEEIELASLREDEAKVRFWTQQRTSFVEKHSALVVHHAEQALALGGILVRGGDWDDPLIGHLIPFGEEGSLFVGNRRLLVRKKGSYWIETPQKTRSDAWTPLTNSNS
jgi:hypothetical protein